MTAAALWLDEVFLSLQGEAGEAGRAQLFLRVAGCPLRCRYCDTPRSWVRQDSFERHELQRSLRRENPVGAGALQEELDAVAASHRCEARRMPLAVTGGEPLEQVDFLEDWLPGWGGPVLLETAGLWPERLERLIPHVDFVSLDWKLGSTLRSGHEALEPAGCAAAFVESGADGWVKIVVADDTEESEVAEALQELASGAPGVRVYLQPATRVGQGPGPPGPSRLLEWALRFRELPLDLRVQPQMHPALGAR